MTLKENILEYLQHSPGATDTELEKHLGKRHQAINQACRQLSASGYLIRTINPQNNLIGNYPLKKEYVTKSTPRANGNDNALQEEDIKRILNSYLIQNNWISKVAWNHQHGADIVAERNGERWVIEVKGPGSRQPMRVNYFIGILGEILQRMDDCNVRYSIAFPDLDQYRRLWNKLPQTAKERTTIDLILVDKNGNITFIK